MDAIVRFVRSGPRVVAESRPHESQGEIRATMGWTRGLLVGITAVPMAWLGNGWCVKRTTPTDAEEHEA